MRHAYLSYQCQPMVAEKERKVNVVRRFNHASNGRPLIDQRRPIPLEERYADGASREAGVY